MRRLRPGLQHTSLSKVRQQVGETPIHALTSGDVVMVSQEGPFLGQRAIVLRGPKEPVPSNEPTATSSPQGPQGAKDAAKEAAASAALAKQQAMLKEQARIASMEIELKELQQRLSQAKSEQAKLARTAARKRRRSRRQTRRGPLSEAEIKDPAIYGDGMLQLRLLGGKNDGTLVQFDSRSPKHRCVCHASAAARRPASSVAARELQHAVPPDDARAGGRAACGRAACNARGRRGCR